MLWSAGDHVEKKADIFFDYNFAGRNTPANTVFQSLSNPENPIDASIIIYPNPVNNILNIQGNNIIRLVEIFDIQGRILQSSIENSNTLQIDLYRQSQRSLLCQDYYRKRHEK